MTLYAQVAVDVKHPDIKNEYTYIVPDKYDSDIKKGSLVTVPFGRSRIEGVVTGVYGSQKPPGNFKLRKIIKVESVSISEKMVALSEQIADYYGASPIDFLKLMLPPKGSVKFQSVYSVLPGEHFLPPRAYLQQKVIDALLLGDTCVNEIADRLSVSSASISGALSVLLKKGFIKKTDKAVRRKPLSLVEAGDSIPEKLTQEQEIALKKICQGFGTRHTILLFGVTGSGKTEIYIRAIEKALQEGKDSILLVPEISLTPQIVAIFQKRFPGRVAVIHSKLSMGERFDEWNRIDAGEAKVVIGPRSAIFAPVRNLGLVVVDEEHESSYKQMEFPFYDARVIAKMRSDQENALLILGSATPSLDTYYESAKGNYELIQLTKRVSMRPLPRMEIVDMTEEMRAGHRQMFSRKLLIALKNTLESGRQAILFLNRRGHSTFVICRDCGYILKCPHCDISLTYHFDSGVGKCHYCGYTVNAPDVCPNCDSRHIRYFGAGTEKIEQEVKKLFPGIKTLRIDSDTTSRKGSLEKMLSSFGKGDAQILVGTQAVAKGLDFPNVTLVGIISADTTLNMPDFRAGERTFQLITQVAGRAGRGEIPGKVYVQTYTPEAFPIKAACKQDTQGFHKEELSQRHKSYYPPYCSIMNVTCSGQREDETEQEAKRILGLMNSLGLDTEIFGPVPAPRPKIKGSYRYNMLIKSKKIETINHIARFLKGVKKHTEVNMAWDVEPQDLL